MPTTISLEHAVKLSNGMRADFMSFPEVTTVVSQTGRPDDGTEYTGFFNAEFSVDLNPQERWPRRLTKLELVDQIDRKLRHDFPGVSFGFSQNIEDNIDEAMSGVKGTNSVKIFSPDLDVDERIANEVMEVMNRVPGVVDTAVTDRSGSPTW